MGNVDHHLITKWANSTLNTMYIVERGCLLEVQSIYIHLRETGRVLETEQI